MGVHKGVTDRGLRANPEAVLADLPSRPLAD